MDGFVSPGLTRVVDGGLWHYAWDGKLEVDADISFTETDCNGTPVGGGNRNPQLRLTGGNGKSYRYGNGPAQTTTIRSILGSDGQCSNTTFDYLSVELVPVDAQPPALKGPLTVYANP